MTPRNLRRWLIWLTGLVLVIGLALGTQPACDSSKKNSAESSDNADTERGTKRSERSKRRKRRKRGKRHKRHERSDRSSDNDSGGKVSGDPKSVVEDVAVKNYGKVIHRGDVDLSKTIARIRAGKKHRHRRDGSVFSNREKRLPKKPRGYYREYVHPTKGVRGPGPQRIVVGKGGEWYYTPDHYKTFKRIDR